MDIDLRLVGCNMHFVCIVGFNGDFFGRKFANNLNKDATGHHGTSALQHFHIHMGVNAHFQIRCKQCKDIVFAGKINAFQRGVGGF